LVLNQLYNHLGSTLVYIRDFELIRGKRNFNMKPTAQQHCRVVCQSS
jgi:hypothetical protein